MNRDNNHLRLLGLFHYVHAGLLSCTTSIGVVYMGFMAAMLPMFASEMEARAARQQAAAKQAEAAAEELEESAESVAEEEEATPSSTPPGPPAAPPPPVSIGERPPEAFFSMISSMMYGMGTFMLVFGFTMILANVYAARCITRRKHHTICLMTAGFNCLNTPFGLILGVCSFLVLLRPTVEELFDDRDPRPTAIIDADIVD